MGKSWLALWLAVTVAKGEPAWGMQVKQGTTYDNTYANGYRDLSALKRLADAHGIASLLIHHLRKEKAADVFNRISGTTAISGAADSSFTLVGEQRGSGRARLSCIGRDIEYRELEPRRNGDNVWEVTPDSWSGPTAIRSYSSSVRRRRDTHRRCSISAIESLPARDWCFRRIFFLLSKTVSIQEGLEYVVLAKRNLSRTEDRREDARWQIFEAVRSNLVPGYCPGQAGEVHAGP